MKLSRWFLILILSGMITLLIVCGFNYVVDPFGVFGDGFTNWHAYNIENNNRTGKIGYLDSNSEKYNSYIIGGSKSSAINPAVLNKYYDGGSFYNMFMYSGDFFDYEQTLYYLVDNYEVDHIIIHMSMHEMKHYNTGNKALDRRLNSKVSGEKPLPFYMKYLTLNFGYGKDKLEGLLKRKYHPEEFNTYIMETGVYNRFIRDNEEIGTEEEYIEKYPAFNDELEKHDPAGSDESLASLARMKEYCDSRDISFKFIVGATYDKEMDSYEEEAVEYFLDEAAKITDFWNFSGYNTISREARNFYDPMHCRSTVGDMMLARIFGDDKVHVPEDFGEER